MEPTLGREGATWPLHKGGGSRLVCCCSALAPVGYKERNKPEKSTPTDSVPLQTPLYVSGKLVAGATTQDTVELQRVPDRVVLESFLAK